MISFSGILYLQSSSAYASGSSPSSYSSPREITSLFGATLHMYTCSSMLSMKRDSGYPSKLFCNFRPKSSIFAFRASPSMVLASS